MLRINFLNEKASSEEVQELAIAVKYQEFSMWISLLEDKIKTVDKKIDNKNGNYSAAQVEGFKEEKKQLVEELKNYENNLAEVESTYNKVIEIMTRKNSEGFGNELENVVTLFRIVASAGNRNIAKYAFASGTLGKESLYEAMETCHSLQNRTDNGKLSMTKEVRDAYKTAEEEIQSILKNALSLPFETPYTKKVRVKFNNKDLGRLHELYVKSANDDFKVEEDGTLIYKKTTLRGAIIKKIDKKGNISYNWNKFYEEIAKAVIPKISL